MGAEARSLKKGDKVVERLRAKAEKGYIGLCRVSNVTNDRKRIREREREKACVCVCVEFVSSAILAEGLVDNTYQPFQYQGTG